MGSNRSAKTIRCEIEEEGHMDFDTFFRKCQEESTVSDFESYLAYCVLEKGSINKRDLKVEEYSLMRDRAFEGRDEEAAKALYAASGAATWKEGEWEGALR